MEAPTTKECPAALALSDLRPQPGTTGNFDQQVLEIVLQYIRVDDSLPLADAALSLGVLLATPDPLNLNGWSPELSAFWGPVLTIAEHIPYDHSSQVKLARLIVHLHLSMSNAFNIFRDKFESMKFSLDMDLMKASVHEMYNPAFSLPPQDVNTFSDRGRCWVNLNTLYANLHSLSGGSLSYFGSWILREAFESTSATYFAALNCHISAAAQWMIHSGQTIFRDILAPLDPETPSQQQANQPWTMDSWRQWKSGFLNASVKVTLYAETREFARRAAIIMDALELSMQGVPDRL